LDSQGGHVRHILLLCVALFFSLVGTAASADIPFKISSNATADSGPLPVLYTCDGKNISPKISWNGKPAKTRSFAFIISDPDAPSGTFYHWVLYNLPANVSSLDEGIELLPEPTKIGTNSFGKTAYNGPCPPRNTNHHYIFTLYALDKNLNLQDGVDAETVLKAMNKHVLGKTDFVAVYTRWV
jgi:Raf kinase inhibitor-like YbhB/YbcL family protein